MKNEFKIQDITKIALCVATLCVTSFLVIPVPFSPVVFSFHTIMVNVIGLILKPKAAGYTVMTYLLMGLIGLPVFSAGTAGPGKLFGPTGGYYFGFLLTAIAISLLKGKKNSFVRYCMVTIAVGIPLQHICAVLMMCVHNGWNLALAFTTISFPFIVGDIVKAVMASVLGVALNKVIK